LDASGNDRNGSDRNGSDRNGSDRKGSDRNGSDRNGSDHTTSRTQVVPGYTDFLENYPARYSRPAYIAGMLRKPLMKQSTTLAHLKVL
jgi:hypothetical protein